MKASANICQTTDPKGSFSAIVVGILIIIGVVTLVDWVLLDIIPNFATLEWLRDLFGVLSGNVAPVNHIAWVYLIIIFSMFVAGVVAMRWWRSLIVGAVVPLIFGISYSLIGMSFGIPIRLGEMFLSPIFFILPFIIPSLIASISITVALSQKKGIWTENLVAKLK